MSKLKSITQDYAFPYNIREALSMRNWRGEFKHAKQRKERGWSDRDCWNAYHHLGNVTAGMLRNLDGVQNVLDWDEYFASNYKTVGDYKNLGEVAQDIENYVNFDETGWADNLGFELKHSFKRVEGGKTEFVSENTKKEQALIRKAIKEHRKQEIALAKKAEKAFIFVGKNLRALWW